MTKNTISDAKNRERIATELDKSFFVEAGAGSGKTHSLVDRMSGLIRYGHAQIENIVAVTFTRKAAANLRERFQIELEDALNNPAVPSHEKDKIHEALNNLEKTFIGTIHSFCAKLLRERPVEAGVDPGFEEIEEDENGVYAERVWSEYIERQGFENNKVIGWMRDNGISPDDLKSMYMTRINYTDVEPVISDVPRPDFSEEKENVREFLESIRREMPDAEPDKGWDGLQLVVVKGLRLAGFGYLREDRKFVILLNLLNKEPRIVKSRWPKGNAEDCQSRFSEFRETVVLPALKRWGEYLHKPLMGFIEDGVRYYEKWRKERSLLNFQDLLTMTAALLRKSTETRKYFKSHTTHLMVDEFQDTDPIQAEIIMLLTGEDDSVSDWRKARPKLGSLFVVGDPKQSIYRFRRADINIYNEVKQIFKTNKDEVLELTSNFRSLPPIRGLTDSVFKSIFPQESTKYQAKFAPLVTVSDEEEGFSSGVIKNEIGKVWRNRPEGIAKIDAERIARWIQNAIAGGVRLQRTQEEKEAGLTETPRPGDFMIITKVKLRLPIYAHALESLRIPYEMSGGESFGESEELSEICKVLKAAADPRDPISLVAALRGQYFGISDDMLYRFKKGGGRFSYYSNPPKGFDLMTKSFERLKKYRDIVMKNSAATAAEKIIENLGAVPLAVSLEMGSTRAGNILKAMELLQEPQADQTGSFSELVENLNTFLTSKVTEEMSLFPGAVRAVRIMNLHKAKGLEAPVVFLADPKGEPKEYEPVIHVNRTEKGSKGYFVMERKKAMYHSEQFAFPVGWNEQKEEEKHYEEAEDKRLEYVAVTRAKNILVVSTYHETTKATTWQSLYDYLEGVPPLETKGVTASEMKDVFNINKAEWDTEREKIENNIRKMRKESYYLATVTKEAKEDTVFRAGMAGGRSWGSIVHKALEACGRGKRGNLRVLAKNWLIEEERPETDIEKLLGLIDGVMKSDMWRRITASKEKYFEMPFALKEEGTVLTGAIDLIFKEDNKWVIVDYKTDDFEKDIERKKSYEKQLTLYAKYWERLTGEKVKETKLYKV